MTKREHAIILPLTVLTYILGIWPNLILDTTVCTVMLLVEIVEYGNFC
jgi:NADH:ubiquinone oxidoreductase subunit 4 (subunit M)